MKELPLPNEDLRLPKLSVVFTKHIAVIKFILRTVLIQVRDDFVKTLNLFIFAKTEKDQRNAYTLISLFAKCILAWPEKAVGNTEKKSNATVIMERIDRWYAGDYAGLWDEAKNSK